MEGRIWEGGGRREEGGGEGVREGTTRKKNHMR